MNKIFFQDAKKVEVTDSFFSQLEDVDVLRADACYLDGDAVDCNDAEDELFIESCEKQSHVSIMKS